MYGYQYNGKGRGQIYSLFKISESAHNTRVRDKFCSKERELV